MPTVQKQWKKKLTKTKTNSPTAYIKNWIKTFVTKPNPVFGNLPPCPFAQKAIIDNKVEFQELTALDGFNTLHQRIWQHDFDKKDVFVRVDSGTYGLKEWGLRTATQYTDIIATVMNEDGRALPKEVIFAKVNQIREIKESTLLMNLDLNPRFYRSIEGSYGLRAWLPNRDEQTLRTPRWLIEDSKSISRCDNASARGYNIEAIVNKDKNI